MGPGISRATSEGAQGMSTLDGDEGHDSKI